MSMKEDDDNKATETAAVADDGVEASEVKTALNAAFDAAEAEEAAETTAAAAKPAAEVRADNKHVETTAGGETTTATAGATTTEIKALSPPASWSIETKAKFATLDPVVQKEVLKREDDFHKGITDYKQDANSYRDIMKVVQPYMPMIQAEGGTPVGVVTNMLNTAYMLRTNPEQTIRGLARQFNVTLPAPGEQEQQVSPEVAALRAELAEFKSGFTAEQQAQHAELQRNANQQLAAFAADPKNVYFADVRASMASLIQSGEAKDIPDAYDKACWMSPQVREARLQQDASEREQKRILEAKRKAADAKRAAFDVSGSGATTSGKSELSLREQLEAAFPQ